MAVFIISEARRQNSFPVKSKLQQRKGDLSQKLKAVTPNKENKLAILSRITKIYKRKWHTMVYIHCVTHILQLEASSSREETQTTWSFSHQSPKQPHYSKVSRHRLKERTPKEARFRGLLVSSKWVHQRRRETTKMLVAVITTEGSHIVKKVWLSRWRHLI